MYPSYQGKGVFVLSTNWFIVEDQNMLNSLEEQPQSARLVGYLNPFGVVPNFVTPVVSDGNERYLIRKKPTETITAFVALDSESERHVQEILQPHEVSIGSKAIYIFLLKDNEVIVDTAEGLALKLFENINQLQEYPRTLLSVLNFIKSKKSDLELIDDFRYQTIQRIASSLMEKTKEIDYKWLRLEFLTTFLDHVDGNGFINYWHLLAELKNLADTNLEIHVQLMLVRSVIGMSPKLKDSLTATGICISSDDTRRFHVNTLGNHIRIDRNNFNQLQQVIETGKAIIVEIQISGPVLIKIDILDSNSTRKRYIKKNRKKIVKGDHARDYLCRFDFNPDLVDDQ